MSRATHILTLVLVCLLSVSAHGAGDEISRFDGRWVARYTSAPSAFYEMEFSGGRFHAVQKKEWYKGEIVIDAEADPARIDFNILECECGFLDKTSEGIFRWDGESIEIRASTPGDPRPTEFDVKSGETMRLVREGDGVP